MCKVSLFHKNYYYGKLMAIIYFYSIIIYTCYESPRILNLISGVSGKRLKNHVHPSSNRTKNNILCSTPLNHMITYCYRI